MAVARGGLCRGLPVPETAARAAREALRALSPQPPRECEAPLLEQLVEEKMLEMGLCAEEASRAAIGGAPPREAEVNRDACDHLRDTAARAGIEDDPRELVRLVYFIQVYHALEQFNRTLHAIASPRNFYLVQVDASAEDEFVGRVVSLAAQFDNVCVLRYDEVVRFSARIVGAALRGVQWAVDNLGASWSHVLTLSGMDYPLVSQHRLASMLSQPAFRSRTLLAPPYQGNPERAEQLAVSCRREVFWFSRRQWFRDFSVAKRPSVGRWDAATSSWRLDWQKVGGFFNVLHRDFARFLVTDPLVLRLWSFFRFTPFADEHFIPVVLYNADRFGGSRPYSLGCFMTWANARKDDGHNDILRARDLASFLGKGYLFARRFDVTVDAAVLDAIDATLGDDGSNR